MAVGLITLTYKLKSANDRISELDITVLNKDHEISDLNANIMASRNAEKEVLRVVEYKDKVIEKKVKEVEQVYVPQVRYVHEFIRIKDETDCNSSQRLFNSTVY